GKIGLAEGAAFPPGRGRTDVFDLLSGDEPDLHDDLRGLWLRTVRKIATVSTALRGLFRMAVPADREPYLAAPFPLRADGVGLAFADLLAQATHEDRGSGAVAARALAVAMMKTRADKTGQAWSW